MTDAPFLPARAPQDLSGAEPFTGLDATVTDFWRFAMNDLRVNIFRGYLAEYLVARAVGATHNRTEWDAYDVLAPDGARIEVKASGYVQAWGQRKPTAPEFRVSASKAWDPEAGLYTEIQGWNADVYVFTLQTARENSSYNALDVRQWAFYVLPRAVVVKVAGARLSLTRLSVLSGGSVVFRELAAASTAARQAALEMEGTG